MGFILWPLGNPCKFLRGESDWCFGKIDMAVVCEMCERDENLKVGKSVKSPLK